MFDMVSRILWFVIVASVVSYGAYFIVGGIVHSKSRRVDQPVVIRDQLDQGAHHLSGMVMVPTPCDELIVRTQAISSSTFMLFFRTWREPSINCPSKEETPRSFNAILFAPAVGVEFGAQLDGKGLPIVVLPVTSDLPRPASSTEPSP